MRQIAARLRDADNLSDFNRVATIEGKLGIPIPLDGLKQTAVNTTYASSHSVMWLADSYEAFFRYTLNLSET